MNTFLKNNYWAIILVAQFSFFYALSKNEQAIFFFSELYEWKKQVHVSLFSYFNISIGDIIYTVAAFLILYYIITLFKKGKTKRRNKLFISLNIFYVIYQSFWGMLYFQTPIMDRLPKKTISEKQISNLAIKYLNLCKASREKVSENKDGIFKLKNIQELKQEILIQQRDLPAFTTNKTPINTLSVKSSLYSNILSYTGILGYYNPFTAESQYNHNLPPTQIPFTLAHEMSHQLGFAREQEASFIGYLCAKKSNNQDLVYSSQLYALKSLLRAISTTNKPLVEKIKSQYSEKMKRDRLFEEKFYDNHDSLLTDVFGFTNDLFLKSNQQEGTISYSYFIRLLILYEG